MSTTSLCILIIVILTVGVKLGTFTIMFSTMQLKKKIAVSLVTLLFLASPVLLLNLTYESMRLPKEYDAIVCMGCSSAFSKITSQRCSECSASLIKEGVLIHWADNENGYILGDLNDVAEIVNFDSMLFNDLLFIIGSWYILLLVSIMIDILDYRKIKRSKEHAK